MQKGLLKLNGGLLSLAKKLAIPVLSSQELLSEILLPNFHILDEAIGTAILEWIASHWEEVKGNQAVCHCLTSLRFVKAGDKPFIFDPASRSDQHITCFMLQC